MAQQQCLPAQGAVEFVREHVDMAKTLGSIPETFDRDGQQAPRDDRRIAVKYLTMLNAGKG